MRAARPLWHGPPARVRKGDARETAGETPPPRPPTLARYSWFPGARPPAGMGKCFPLAGPVADAPFVVLLIDISKPRQFTPGCERTTASSFGERSAPRGRVKVLMKGSHIGQVDSRFRGNDVYPVRTLTMVIPAKAGIHCCQARSLAPRL